MVKEKPLVTHRVTQEQQPHEGELLTPGPTGTVGLGGEGDTSMFTQQPGILLLYGTMLDSSEIGCHTVCIHEIR